MGHIIDKILDRRRRRERNNVSSSSLASNGGSDRDGEKVRDDGVAAAAVLPQYYSFEFFPPKTEAGLENLLSRMDRMATRLDPLFVSVTWGGSGSSAMAQSLELARRAQKYLGVDVLLHLGLAGMTHQTLVETLDKIKSDGTVRNILALRGDPPRGRQRSWEVGDVSGCDGGLDRAVDLVKLIRSRYGSYFCVAVAGHPEGHPSSTSPDEEMRHLKEKMDAGADLIITQFFYDAEQFFDFVRRCRAAGIEAPILPGILPIQSYSNFCRMTEYCGVRVPQQLRDRLEPVKDDDDAVKRVGCEVATEMCRQILKELPEDVDGVHFYTLNLERSVTQILVDMGAVDFVRLPQSDAATAENGGGLTMESSAAAAFNGNAAVIRTTTGRPLPWRPSAMSERSRTEQVRPINWANRPKSYVMRTEDWDEFPNGRWGDATSPAFGELSNLSHFYSFSLGSEEDQREVLGHDPSSEEDVFEVFARYVEGRIPHIPWCETPLQPESFVIQRQLAKLNRVGFLTINSQPFVNAAPSTDKTYGWGGPGGYVYQKAYCECFCSPDNARRLAEMVKRHNSMNLYAVTNDGAQIQEGVELGGVTALTWGVFPNREILQPTIFDPGTFLVWAEEAFSLWTSMWSHLYDYDSDSFELIETIRDTYYLCAIIDNDYISEHAHANNSSSRGGDDDDTSNSNNSNGGGSTAAANGTSCSLWGAMLEASRASA